MQTLHTQLGIAICLVLSGVSAGALAESVGQIRQTGIDFCPRGELPADGKPFLAADHSWLNSVIGCAFGGDCGYSFELPDLRSRTPIGAGQGEGLANFDVGDVGGSNLGLLMPENLPAHSHTMLISGQSATYAEPAGHYLAGLPAGIANGAGGETLAGGAMNAASVATVGESDYAENAAFDLYQPYLAVSFCVVESDTTGSTPFIGQISAFASAACPENWLAADGAILPINSYTPLFSLLGTDYGGDGRTTFALPDLRGRMAMGNGSGPGLQTASLGDELGEASVVLNTYNLLPHNHPLLASSAAADTASPVNAALPGAVDGALLYSDELQNTSYLDSATLGTSGENAPLDIRHPYSTVRYCIAVDGVYPPRN